MSNINDSLIKVSETMKNSYSGFDISDGLRESIVRMKEQLGDMVRTYDLTLIEQLRNMVKVFDSALLVQNQSKYIKMSSQISEQLRYSMKWTQNIEDFSAVSNTLIQLSKEMNSSYRDIYKVLHRYDYVKLSKIIRDTLKKYDYNSSFDVNVVTEQITESYIADEEAELFKRSESFKIKDRKEYVKNIRDWIGFCITIIGFFISIYSLVSAKPSNTYNTTIEVNNYYVNDLEISAEMLNAMSYRIVAKNDVMPRIKPDCSSRVIGHLNMGQVVTMSQKYKKWVKIEWEDESGNYCTGWVQNYKLTKFK